MIKKMLICLLVMMPYFSFGQTTITQLGATDRVDRTVLNANFNNLKATADATHPSTTNQLSHDLYMWSNSWQQVSNLVGIGSGTITGFYKIYVGTVDVSTIAVGTGTVDATSISNWNANYNWYSLNYTNVGFTPSNNIWGGTNTFTNTTYLYRSIRTNPDHVYQDHELVDYDTVVDIIGGLIGDTFYGATNTHPVITANQSMIADVPPTWAITNALDQGTNLIGTFYWTNAITSFVPAGSYLGHFHGYLSADREVWAYIELICSDGGATTNVIVTSSLASLGIDLASYDLYMNVPTNYYCAGEYLGVRYYANKTVAQAANLITYGGTNYLTQLSLPSLSGGIDTTLFIKKDGSVAWTGTDNHGGQAITNTANILPDGNATRDLGSSAKHWNYLWADKVAFKIGGYIFSTTADGFVFNSDLIGYLATRNITNFVWAGTFTTNTPSDGQIVRYNATAGRWYAYDYPDTNAAIIDATNRTAGVGYLLPASTQNLVTASITNGLASLGYVDSATNAGLTTAKAYTDSKVGKATMVFGPITTNASPDNYIVLGPFPYASTATNICAYGDGGTWVSDLFLSDRTNAIGGRTLCYTGVTYTAGTLVTNLPVSIPIPAGKWLGCVLTNGASPTNAWVSVELTY